MTTKKNRQPERMSRGRILLIVWCLIGAAWTFRGVLAGHRVADYSFEDALHMVKTGPAPQTMACVQLRDRICEAIAALREAGEEGQLAVEAIHKESHR